MPTAKKRFYSTKDIRTILNVSETKALEIMHMFDRRGLLMRDGKLMRVEISHFESWLNSCYPARS